MNFGDEKFDDLQRAKGVAFPHIYDDLVRQKLSVKEMESTLRLIYSAEELTSFGERLSGRCTTFPVCADW